jgi:hypothetical protein
MILPALRLINHDATKPRLRRINVNNPRPNLPIGSTFGLYLQYAA